MKRMRTNSARTLIEENDSALAATREKKSPSTRRESYYRAKSPIEGEAPSASRGTERKSRGRGEGLGSPNLSDQREIIALSLEKKWEWTRK